MCIDPISVRFLKVTCPRSKGSRRLGYSIDEEDEGEEDDGAAAAVEKKEGGNLLLRIVELNFILNLGRSSRYLLDFLTLLVPTYPILS